MGLIVTEISETMTPEEYTDLLFERQKRKLEKEVQESEIVEDVDNDVDNFLPLIQKLSDYEAEINILEELIINRTNTSATRDRLIKDLKSMKARYTKTKNKIDNLLKEEQQDGSKRKI